MTTTNTTKRTPANPSIHAKPLTVAQQPKTRPVGRPEKLVMPPMPELEMTDLERDLYDFFMDSYKQQYPDMVPSDLLLLHLAGVEYIKYLRILAEELATGQVIGMARQHPGVQMRSLLDQLSTTRKARTAHPKETENEDARELRDFFLSGGKGKTRH